MIRAYFIPIFLGIFCLGCTPKSMEKQKMKSHLEQLLNRHTLDLWYPKVIDFENGGFYSNFSFDWAKEKEQPKFIVTQARHLWTLSKVFQFYPERTKYKNYAHHGFEFLKNKMFDSEQGGFYQIVDETGQVPDGEYTHEKRLYGNAFAIYALAAYYEMSGDTTSLNLAIRSFRWLDIHDHDSIYGGYFQYMQRDGTIIPRSALAQGYDAPDKKYVGLKDYNSSIHTLEAFTELYQVWPNDTLKDRLYEMYKIVSETMYAPPGYLQLYFHPDWTIVKEQEFMEVGHGKNEYIQHITFGHDVETAFLLLEAAKVLGIAQEEILPKAKRMVDHALEKGWDMENGGFYEKGIYEDGEMVILDYGKNWWSQAEGINSLLLMHKHFPDDPQQYYQKFELLVDYIDQNMIDHENLGWYSGGVDHDSNIKKLRKSQIWKGTYHTSRSLMHCISMLE